MGHRDRRSFCNPDREAKVHPALNYSKLHRHGASTVSRKPIAT